MSTITTTDHITLEQYEHMVDAGVFADRRPIELLDGELVEKMTQNPPHTVSDEACGLELARVIPAGWHVRGGKPVRLPPQDSEPEPDRSVVRGGIWDYETRHPGPSDIALVVEVADATLVQDQGRKLRTYATAGISVYWIVNLIDNQVEVYTEPQPGAYRSRAKYQRDQLVPVVIDGNQVGEIAVNDIMPRRRTGVETREGER
jgi:Uma2 family endonuclease